MLLLEACHGRPQPQPPEAEGAGQVDVACQLCLALGQLFLQRSETVQQAGGMGMDDIAFGGGGDAAGGAQEQAVPQPCLDGRQALGGQGGSHAELFGRRTEAVQFMDSPYQGQVTGVH